MLYSLYVNICKLIIVPHLQRLETYNVKLTTNEVP